MTPPSANTPSSDVTTPSAPPVSPTQAETSPIGGLSSGSPDASSIPEENVAPVVPTVSLYFEDGADTLTSEQTQAIDRFVSLRLDDTLIVVDRIETGQSDPAHAKAARLVSDYLIGHGVAPGEILSIVTDLSAKGDELPWRVDLYTIPVGRK